MDSFAKETLPVSLEEEMRRSYLDYAMSVIVGRALPDVRDGLKPVHRRVLFAMHELSNDWNKAYKKSARIVGDVIGKYHPHGDTAVYDTIVRMAQDFSLRYPLVDGQGNFGSIDGDNAAAMRYTEIRMARIAHELLADIDKDTVDFGPNYDGSENEPLVLPAKIPNLLINGSSGIAVGMATNIPPHNMNEVVDACLKLLGEPETAIEELIEIMPAPDFPTYGIIYGTVGVKEGYRTGRGRVVMRARCHFEDIGKGERQAIIVDELPYQVNKANLCIKIGELVREKRIEGISDLRDESDKSGMRVVIELKRGEVPEVILNQLYKDTQMQDTFGMNMVALVDGQPRLLNLKQMLDAFLRHRREVVTRRTVFELRKARDRGHILEGLAVALANVDEMIAIIKAAPTPPDAKRDLMARPWKSPVVHEMLQRAAADASRPEGLSEAYGLKASGYMLVRRAGAGNPANAPATAHRTGAGQDRRGIQGGDGAHRRSPGHPGAPGTGDPDHCERAGRRQGSVRRQTAQRDRRERPGPVAGRPDRARGRGGHAVALGLRQVPAGGRLQGAKARRARQTGDGDERRRLHRQTVHRQYPRSHPVLLQPRPGVLDQGVRSAPGQPRVARKTHRQPAATGRRREDQRHSAGQGIYRRHLHLLRHRRRHGEKTALSQFANPRKAGIIAIALDEGDYLIGVALTDGQHDVMLFSDEGKAVRFDENDVRANGPRHPRRARHEPSQRRQVIALLVGGKTSNRAC